MESSTAQPRACTCTVIKAVSIISALFGVFCLQQYFWTTPYLSRQVSNESLKLSSLRAPDRNGPVRNKTSDFDATQIESGSQMIFNPWHEMPEMKNEPRLEAQDIIYGGKNEFDNPIVNEEFKIIFFHMPKVASSEWKRFFIRLGGLPKNKWCHTTNVHDRATNGLKYLDDYPVKTAQKMMTSPEWTRTVFVRHPKPRILSAFLDKSVQHHAHFEEQYCKTYAHLKGGMIEYMEDCIARHEDFEFFLYNFTTTLSHNRHWEPIYSLIDEKWWPWINFIGRMEELSDNAESLLKAIKSENDGVSAWDRLGKTGWSGMEKSGVCDNGTKAFLEMDEDPMHATHAKQKLNKYYTPELERFVEEYYADDLSNPYFHFEDLR